MEHHQIVARRYQIRHEVGRGNYGRVYAGRDIETGRDVAIKVQKTPEGSKHIANEITVYKQLGNNGTVIATIGRLF